MENKNSIIQSTFSKFDQDSKGYLDTQELFAYLETCRNDVSHYNAIFEQIEKSVGKIFVLLRFSFSS